MFGSTVRVAPEKAVLACSSAVREWDSNGTNFGYNPARKATAGEFGHMTIGRGAPVACAAGSYECWEAFASESAAIARYAKRSGNQINVDFGELVDRGLSGEKDAEVAYCFEVPKNNRELSSLD